MLLLLPMSNGWVGVWFLVLTCLHSAQALPADMLLTGRTSAD